MIMPLSLTIRRRCLFMAFCLCFVINELLIPAPVRADLMDGINASEREDYETAACEFRPYAERGITMVQYMLGVLYMYGKGVPQDYVEAEK